MIDMWSLVGLQKAPFHILFPKSRGVCMSHAMFDVKRERKRDERLSNMATSVNGTPPVGIIKARSLS